MSVNKVLLLGGTGAIGSYLTDVLCDNGWEVYVTTRHRHDSSYGVHFLVGNAKNDNAYFLHLMKSHWDAIVDFLSYKTAELSSRLNTLLNATNQYVLLSSARVFADLEHPIKEDSPRLLDVSKDSGYLLTDEYALAKARQENLLINNKHKNWTIVRPYITYSDKRIQLGVLEKEEWLYRTLHGRSIVFCKEFLDKRTSLANGYDVSIGISQLLGRKEALGEAFNLTTSERLTWQQIYDIYSNVIRQLTGQEPKIKLVSLDAFLSCRHADLKYQVIYDRLYNRDFDTSKESQFVNPLDFIKVEDGLTHCVKNFINSNTLFKNIDWSMEAKKDKLTNEYTSLYEIRGIKNKFKYFITRYI